MASDAGKQVARMLGDFGKKLNEMMGKGREEARRMARTAQIGLEIMTLSAQRIKLMENLGEAFYAGFRKPGGSRRQQAALAEMVTQIRELEKTVASLKRAMKKGGGEEPPRRRGRPPKTSAAKPAKKGRRGRPPKARGKRGPGRPRKAAKAVARRRRGRPRKTVQVKAAAGAASAAPAAGTAE